MKYLIGIYLDQRVNHNAQFFNWLHVVQNQIDFYLNWYTKSCDWLYLALTSFFYIIECCIWNYFPFWASLYSLNFRAKDFVISLISWNCLKMLYEDRSKKNLCWPEDIILVLFFEKKEELIAWMSLIAWIFSFSRIIDSSDHWFLACNFIHWFICSRQEQSMHFDGSSFVVRNNGHSAGFDENNYLRVY